MSDNGKNTVSIDEKASSDAGAPSPLHTPEEERALVRKLDWRIMPIACIMYLFACEYPVTVIARESFERILCFPDLDRTNLGNARLQGLPEDVLGGDPTGKLFDWVNSAFFFSYVRRCMPSIFSACSRRGYLRRLSVKCPQPSSPNSSLLVSG